MEREREINLLRSGWRHTFLELAASINYLASLRHHAKVFPLELLVPAAAATTPVCMPRQPNERQGTYHGEGEQFDLDTALISDTFNKTFNESWGDTELDSLMQTRNARVVRATNICPCTIL